MRALRYVVKLLRCHVLSPLPWVVLVATMVIAALPLNQNMAMYAGMSFEERVAQDRDNLLLRHESLSSPLRSTMPEALQTLDEQEVAALEDAVSATTTREYCRSAAERTELQKEQLKQGFLVGPTDWELDAELRFYHTLAQLENPQFYSSTTDMPGLMYVSFVFARGATFVWTALPLVSMFFLLSLTRREKLLGAAPVPRWAADFSAWALSVLLGTLGLLVAFLPSLLIATLTHGLGDPSYPIVFTMREEVVQTTLASLLMRQAALYMMTCAFLSAVELLICRLAGRPSVGMIVAFVVSALPTMSGYLDSSGTLDATNPLLCALPTTYLNFGSVVGYPLFFFAQQIPSIEGVTFERGVVTLATSTLVSLAVSQVVRMIVSIGRARRREVGHART